MEELDFIFDFNKKFLLLLISYEKTHFKGDDLYFYH